MALLERIHLTIIREVHRLGSLTAAAETLCLTQSALSHTMRKLEQQAGTPVWIREGRHLRLTQAGEDLLALAGRVLPQLEEAESRMVQYARGERGSLRIGMECHPCYQWLLRVVDPFIRTWPQVDVDVRQRFQFGGIEALLAYEIDVLVTPDPIHRPGLRFEPVFDYELVLVVAREHALAGLPFVEPAQLATETLIAYPVSLERLDIYHRFLTPAGILPRRHKVIETTDIMVSMVAAGRGVAAMPRWLAEEYAGRLGIVPVRLGPQGIPKQICLGLREADGETDYLQDFFRLARRSAGA
nr:LysR family transcriptional regulator [uncultured Holophaga sp.]